MSDLSQLDLIRLAVEAKKINRLEQIFPTIAKGTFAKEIGWNPSKLGERMENARLLDMQTIRKIHKALLLTPMQAFLLSYNQYLHNLGEPPYPDDQ